jgi:hypothetical protein
MSTDSPVVDRARLARIQRRFGEFAAEYAALPLYAALCRELARDDEAAALLLAARPGQARPVLWLAAVHELVLRNPDSVAAPWYPSVAGRDAVASGDPWPSVRRVVMEHRGELVERIATHGTQTNEVNRAVYVAVGLVAATADRPDRPVALVELGASAGLLLGVDRFAVELSSPGSRVHLGDAASPVRCAGVDRAGVGVHLAQRGLGLPAVVGRVGLDVAPVDLDDDDAVRWLEACLWPEVPGRIERLRSARELVRSDPPDVLRGDMVEGLPEAAERARAHGGRDAHVIVLSSWAVTYLEPARRGELVSRLRTLARDVPDLTWLSAEPPWCVPGVPVPDGADDGDTVIGLSRWRAGVELAPVALGTCHPHGAWIDVDPAAIDALTGTASPL